MKLNKTRFIRNKTEEEVKFLEDMFVKDPHWCKSTVQICKETLNLSTTQVYKWGFDKKKLLKKYWKNSGFGDLTQWISQVQNSDLKLRCFLEANREKRKIKKSKTPTQSKGSQRRYGKASDLQPNRILIDYNKEVDDLINSIELQANSDHERRSDKDEFFSINEQSAKSDMSQRYSKELNTWLDEIWEETPEQWVDLYSGAEYNFLVPSSDLNKNVDIYQDPFGPHTNLYNPSIKNSSSLFEENFYF